METGYSQRVERDRSFGHGAARKNKAKDREATRVTKRAEYEKKYFGQPEEILKRRMDKLNEIIGQAETGLAFRQLVSKGMDTKAGKKFHEEASDAVIERLVIQGLLPAEGEVVSVGRGRSRSEAVDKTIAVEAARERAEVLAETQRQEELAGKQMERLVGKTKESSGDVVMGALARDTRRREVRARALKQMPRDKMTHEVTFELGKKQEAVMRAPKPHVEKPKDPYALMSGREKPEGFFGWLKRSMFGSESELMKAEKEKEKKLDARIKEEKVRLKNVTREARVQSPRTSAATQRELMQTRVISARKTQEREPGFLGGLWKRLTGQIQREERAARYRSNIEKVGRGPEYVLNPRLGGARHKSDEDFGEIAAEDLEEITGGEETEKKDVA